jgi:formylglycine-generating enzyme required for sulfatase activity
MAVTLRPPARRGLLRTAALAAACLAIVGTVGATRLLPTRPVPRPLPPVEPVADDDPPPTRPALPELTNSLGMRLVQVPAGRFLMGTPALGRFVAADEQPQREVEITRPFYLGKHEVTRGQFRAFVEATGYQTDAERASPSGPIWRRAAFPQTEDHPVVHVTWNDAAAFCAWLSRKEGRRYSLPTEAQWEYACRARTLSRYHSGEMFDLVVEVGNVADGTARQAFPDWDWALRAEDGYVYTAPVGQYWPNAWGLHDVHGNVWEWCADWYAADYYGRGPAVDPAGPAAGSERVARGGAWNSPPRLTRSAARGHHAPDYHGDALGFRVCLAAD